MTTRVVNGGAVSLMPGVTYYSPDARWASTRWSMTTSWAY